MGNNYSFIMLALVTGALIPIQAATNTAFSKSIGNAALTSIMVFSVALVAGLVYVLSSRTAIPQWGTWTAAPWYGYLGGPIVAIYVIMITIITPRLGVGNAIGLIVTGQIICAILIDHFGLFNSAVKTVDLTRIVGALMMIGGIYLVMKKR